MKQLLDGLWATYGLRTPVIEGPVIMTALFAFPWTTGYNKRQRVLNWIFNTKRPDTDNLLKPLNDKLSGRCYKDDSQIVGVKAYKIRYEVPFVVVLLDEVQELNVQTFSFLT